MGPGRRDRRTLSAATIWVLIPLAAGIGGSACAADPTESVPPRLSSPGMEDDWERLRLTMVEQQIEARGVEDPAVLAALRKVPRHEFVPEELRAVAYEDRPLPIGHDQTISQPYIVAVMTELAHLRAGSKVLEVGTGSGYQAAVVHEITGGVHSIEIVEPLAREAAETLRRLGYDEAVVRHGDGYRGWPEEAPFDAILVTAAPEQVPQPLLDQLAPGGRLVVPVGGFLQHLEVHTRTAAGIRVERVLPVRFVPMTGEAQE